MAIIKIKFTEEHLTFVNVNGTYEYVSKSDFFDAISSKNINLLTNLAKNKSKIIRDQIINNPNATETVKRLVLMTNKK